MTKKTMWQRIESWCADNPVEGHAGFNPPATEADFRSLERAVKLPLSPDFKEIYSIHNGGGRRFLPEGMWLLCTKEIQKDWNTYRELAEHERADWSEELGEWDAPDDEGLHRTCVHHPKRLPLATREDGPELFLDFAPGPKGTKGQVLYLINECDFRVVGSCLRHFLERWLEVLESRKATLSNCRTDGNF